MKIKSTVTTHINMLGILVFWLVKSEQHFSVRCLSEVFSAPLCDIRCIMWQISCQQLRVAALFEEFNKDNIDYVQLKRSCLYTYDKYACKNWRVF